MCKAFFLSSFWLLSFYFRVGGLNKTAKKNNLTSIIESATYSPNQKVKLLGHECDACLTLINQIITLLTEAHLDSN